jgi:hypothetical protein
MKPNKTKKAEEKDTDPKISGNETGTGDQKEAESNEASSEEQSNSGKEPYVDFSKLF